MVLLLRLGVTGGWDANRRLRYAACKDLGRFVGLNDDDIHVARNAASEVADVSNGNLVGACTAGVCVNTKHP